MKTIEEAAKEHIDTPHQIFTRSSSSFKAGAEFVQRWIPVDEELPICEKLDRWDGKGSDSVLVICSNKYWTKAKLFSDIVNGEPINEWYVEGGDILPDVTHWRPIEVK